MEDKVGIETEPAKERLFYRKVILNSNSDKQEGNGEVKFSENGGIVENVRESEIPEGVVLLLTPLQTYPSENEPDCITLSSDEEIEGDEEQWRKNVVNLVMVQMEDGGKDEREVGNFKDIEAKPGKSKIKKGTRKGKRNGGPAIVKEKVEREKPPNNCNYCGKTMKTRKYLKEHILKQHKSPAGISLLKCETCGEKMRSKHLLQYHQRIHSNEHLFGCNLCGIKFKSQFYQDKHFNSNEHKDSEFVQQLTKNQFSEGLLLKNKEGLTEIGTKSKSTTFPETSTISPPPIQYPSTTSSGGVSLSMTHNLQPIPTPVLFHGYMIQPNGASFSIEYPPVIQSKQPSPFPSSFGIASPQDMQLLSFQRHPYIFLGHSQQPSLTLFTCMECKAMFSVEAHFQCHMQTAHSNDCWKCPKCLDVMLSPGKFEKHYSQCVGVKSAGKLCLK